jgi:hypothetical protein
MKRIASLLVASLFAAFLVTTCVTTAFWAGTVADSQTNQHQGATQQDATLDPRVLLLQSAEPSNSTQASRAFADNITRIIVPISKVENTSSSSAQLFSGFEFPTWLWIPVILVLLVILAYLFLKLLREGDNEPPVEKRPLTPASASEARGQQSRQIPINESEIEAERKNSSPVAAESKSRSIPIDASEELREPDEDSP